MEKKVKSRRVDKKAARIRAEKINKRRETIINAISENLNKITSGKLEADILMYIQEKLRKPWMTKILNIISRTGDPAVMCSIPLVLTARRKTREVGLIALQSLVISFVLNNLVLKNVFKRTRPYEAVNGLNLVTRKEKDHSFPSGHTANTFAVARAIAENVSLPLKIFLMVYAILMGFSRIYLGVHYPGDVIAGALSGNTVGNIVGKRGMKKKNGEE